MRRSGGLVALAMLALSGAACLEDTDVGYVPNGVYYLDDDVLVFLIGEEQYYPEPDLNGDGDWSDEVVQVYRMTDGTTTNFGLASGSSYGHHDELLTIADGILVVSVLESRQGGTDLNGDGDAVDEVLHVLDLSTGKLTNLGVGGWFEAGATYFLDDRRLVYLLPETTVDLNGDGDTEDEVWHVYDVDRETTTCLGLASGPTDPTPSYEPSVSQMHGGRFAFRVIESAQGGTDLNGDGDIDDADVLHVWDAATGRVTNTEYSTRDKDILWGGQQIVFSVSEQNQGRSDLNGDGDAWDQVVHVFNLETETGWSTGLATHGGRHVARDGNLLAIGTESGTLAVYDIASRAFVDLGLFDWGFDLRGEAGVALHRYLVDAEAGHVFFAVDESHQGVDLTGNGTMKDYVLHRFDAERGMAVNLGLAVVTYGVDGDGRRFGFAASETGSGLDLNGDGDLDDRVMHVYDAQRGLRNLRISNSSGTVDVKDSIAAFEGPTGLDLYDFETRRVYELGFFARYLNLLQVEIDGSHVALVDFQTRNLHLATIHRPGSAMRDIVSLRPHTAFLPNAP